MSDAMFLSPLSPPYVLPLSREAFSLALQVGHGRAWEHASVHGIADRVDLVVHACLHDLAYDPQCEGGRERWILKIIDAAAAEDLVFPQLIKHAAEAPTGDKRFWDELQRCAIMKHLVDRGVEEARPLLYGMFRESVDSLDLVGCNEIIQIDGADGLIHICEALGRSLVRDPKSICSDLPLQYFENRHGKDSALKALSLVRQSSTDVARYLDHLETYKGDREKRGYRSLSNVQLTPTRETGTQRYEARTAEEVIASLEPDGTDEAGYWLTQWGRAASVEQLATVTTALERETAASQLAKYLRIFHRRSLPTITDKVLALVDHEDEQVRWSAYRALSQVKHTGVRQLALRLLRPEAMARGALRLFESNYLPGDHSRIEEALFIPRDREDLHTVVFDLVEIFAHRPVTECQKLMLFVYEHSPCSNCRGNATEILHKCGVLPHWLASEARLDANEAIRNGVSGADRDV